MVTKRKSMELPKGFCKVNCQFCLDEGRENINKFELFGYKESKKFLFFKCLECNRIFRGRTVLWGRDKKQPK